MSKDLKQLFILAIVFCVMFIGSYYFLPDDTSTTLVVSVSDNQVNMEDYVVHVVAAEMPASFEIEALKAQCVAVRSYAIAHDLNVDTTTNTQVYKSEEELKAVWGNEYNYYINRIKKAAEETYNQVMYYDNKVISAYYFAASNGTTSVCEEYFTESLPYIKSVSSSLEMEDYGGAIVTTSFSNEALKEIFKAKDNVSLVILDRYDTGRVKEVKVNNTVYSGKEFRELLDLRSSDFKIKKLCCVCFTLQVCL